MDKAEREEARRLRRRAVNLHLFRVHGVKDVSGMGDTQARILTHGDLHAEECGHTHEHWLDPEAW